jgi:hypothetical protein
LHLWLKKENGESIDHFKKGVDCLKEVYFSFFPVSQQLVQEASTTDELTQSETPNTAKSTNSEFVFETFYQMVGDKDEDRFLFNSQVELLKRRNELDAEIKLFTSKLLDPRIRNGGCSSKEFWIENFDILPNLSKLYIALSTIPGSSSFIERFFSLCGIVCSKRNLRMKEDLIEVKCLLKSNMHLLNELNKL